MKLYKNTVIFVIAVAVILLIVILPSVLFTEMLSDDIAIFTNHITTINELATQGIPSDSEEIRRETDALEQSWNKHKRHWNFYVHHGTVDSIDMLMGGYIILVRSGAYESALPEAERIFSMLEAVEEHDKLNLENLI